MPDDLRPLLEILVDALAVWGASEGWPDALYLPYLAACKALGRSIAGSGPLVVTETCPACNGHATSHIFFDGHDEHGEHQGHVSETVCPFCLGEGVIPSGVASWPVLGDRLRLARLRHTMPWYQDDFGRYWFTFEDVELRPMPLPFLAQRWGVPERLLYQAEAGVIDPRTVAAHLDLMMRDDLEGTA